MRFSNLAQWAILVVGWVAGESTNTTEALAPPPKLMAQGSSRSPLAALVNDEKSLNSTGKTGRSAMNGTDTRSFPLFVRFLGWPQAVTSESAHQILEGLEPSKLPATVLDSRAAPPADAISNTQILYEKVYSTGTAPLVSVLLMDENRPSDKQLVLTLFKDKFDMMGQKCSCYWIDAKDMASKTSITKSDKYYLRMVDTLNPESKFDARSGYFSIVPN